MRWQFSCVDDRVIQSVTQLLAEATSVARSFVPRCLKIRTGAVFSDHEFFREDACELRAGEQGLRV